MTNRQLRIGLKELCWLVAPVLTTALAILAVGAIWERRDPLPPEADRFATILDAQRARAAAGSPSDVLIIGDSSALVGIDAHRLGSLLGGSEVQSLALLGLVGPAGYAALLDQYLASVARAPRCLLIALHGESLGVDEERFVRSGYERAVLEPAAPRLEVLARGREKLFREVFAAHLAFPALTPPGRLPKPYEIRFGDVAGYRRHIDAGLGTTIDPRWAMAPAAQGSGEPFPFVLTDAVERRLSVLAASARRSGAAVYLLITPIPRAREAPTTSSARREVAVDLARIFELPLERVLIPAPHMRTDLFVSRTHLTARGRRVYTGVLARRLEKTRCVESYESRGSSR